jgi:hypothetical protein
MRQNRNPQGVELMRKLACFFLLTEVLALSSAVQAQKAVIFGGYQYTHIDPSWNGNGWNGALTGNFAPWLGIRADFSGAYKSGLKFHTYTFGPEVALPLPIVKPFVHALFGGARASGGGSSTNGFDMMYGGGLDYGHGPIAFRVIQFDWMVTRFSGSTDKSNVRACTGIVLRF